jgi:hypothetical protein
MLKISSTGMANKRIVGPWVVELRKICEVLLGEGRAPKLDLADVLYVDADGVAALTKFQSRGVGIINCSPFVEEQLKNPEKD